ncbi:general transcription factor II-I repeat domain-containing protein 2-like [Clavelina lepadiformis]|uniref:general transcription factor II-I repeat domain-containing protein 2-like n=1 Tax=Clavelina lepadiformis TaxID=159417 RepID=UPI004040F75C
MLIANKFKPYDDGTWAKEILVKAAEKLAPKSVHLFQKLSLSRPTVCERIQEMGQDIEDNLKKRAGKFVNFSLCLDETTDIKNIAQLAIFFRGITSDFHIEENLLSLESIHGTTRGEDLLQKLLQALGKFNLPLDKLCGVATDGAPAMVGKHKGLVSLLKKEMGAKGIRHDGLVFCHILCAKSVKFDHVISVVTDCINFIKKRDLNNRIFKQVLKDFDADYDDLLYYCAVRWTSCGNMLRRFNSLLPEIIEFRNLKKCPLTEIEDENWLCDLGFMVDFTKYLNELNVQLQGPNQLLHTMFSKIKSFMSLLSLWENQLKDNKHNPTSCTQYALECSSLLESFKARFQDIKSKQLELDIFSIPFNVTPGAPSELQLELIKLQSDDALKAMYLNKPLLEFYRVYFTKEEFPNLRAFALKWLSVFGSTYLCEQFFSKLNITKSRYRSRLTDENLSMQLRVATSSVRPNIERLVKRKNFQKSH